MSGVIEVKRHRILPPKSKRGRSSLYKLKFPPDHEGDRFNDTHSKQNGVAHVQAWITCYGIAIIMLLDFKDDMHKRKFDGSSLARVVHILTTRVQCAKAWFCCIDVMRYKGYDELQYDLARMFGIEGQLEDPHRTEWIARWQLEDPHRTEWKLLYVDSDILLVGDDPWDVL
ncbi:unnamed protein product [Lupinus luteus]|uniref:Hexosyltransferase n=1 Tax=Lupinus luteus TaxID=3873 RepID=A0AAV1WFN4_LUPLU